MRKKELSYKNETCFGEEIGRRYKSEEKEIKTLTWLVGSKHD